MHQMVRRVEEHRICEGESHVSNPLVNIPVLVVVQLFLHNAQMTAVSGGEEVAAGDCAP